MGVLRWLLTGERDTEKTKDAPATEGVTDGVTADYTIQADGQTGGRLVTSNMSQEQLRLRRMNLIEGTKFGCPFHENFMLVGLRIWLVIALSHDPNMKLLYIFVASRVIGFILGDASTAFFLAKVDGSNLKLIARSEREKAGLYRDIAAAEGERKLIGEKAEADILIVQIEVAQKREEVEFMAALKRQMFDDILQRRSALPSGNRSTVRRLDTGS